MCIIFHLSTEYSIAPTNLTDNRSESNNNRDGHSPQSTIKRTAIIMATQGPPPGMGPIMVLNSKTQRTHGRQAQLGNIAAARAVADIIRSTLGPRSMLKVRSCFHDLDGDIILCDSSCHDL